MNRRTLVVAIGSVALRVLGCSSAGQSQGPSTPVTQEDVGNAGLPPPLEVPAGNRLTSSLDGSGVQVYQCATGLARTAYRRRMLTCSPARRFRCSARDDVDGRGGYPSNSVAGTIRSPRRASRGWTGMRRVGVQPARSSECPRVRAAALRAAGAGGWLAQHVDRPVAPLGADG